MGIKEPAFEGKFTGVFVDDEDLVRTGRAWMEVTSGNGVVHIPLSAEHHRLREQVQRDAQAVAEGKAAFDETLRKVQEAESATLPAAEAAKKSQQAAESAAGKAARSESAAAQSQREASGSAEQTKMSQEAAKRAEAAAGESANRAAQSEKTAGEQASKAGERAGEASAAQAAAEAARDKALASERAAGEHAKTAAQSVEQAAIHEQAARTAQSGVADALNGAKGARTGAEKARDEARQAAESAIVGIKPDSVQKSMLAVDLRGEIDAKVDKAVVEKQLGEKADSADVDRRIGEIPKPTWSELEGKPADFKPSAHTHATKEITGLDDVLKAKADLSTVDEKIKAIPKPVNTWGELQEKPAKFPPEEHTHTTAQVTGLDGAIEEIKSSISGVKAFTAGRPAFFSGKGKPPATIPGAAVGDYYLDESTMELHKITGV
ncbi:hypothetical protein CIP107532_00569 [Corynebacterium diphtheriae]|uniref:hypothetical protein n=1 Tax=Corynebacterium diphtheriae TaxID=1717 RepID=UPI000A1F04DF|nr:hypothetical protein [Corynebacterium diphtheriae]OSQ22080.1 hypothetical protein B1A52_00340 [Corynebacterium diphtheriae]CAB0550110.1 hypothetical protein CIP107532_00569 [Corynebacterium diphtheriae]